MRTYYMIVCLLKLRTAEQMSAHALTRLHAHESKQYRRKMSPVKGTFKMQTVT